MSDVKNETMQQQPLYFDSIKIGLASPEKIREWSRGEVTKPETINYRTLKPERDGLFCERIFGPSKDWECHCGKYKKVRFKGTVCERCGVEITKASVRRERMGHIELAAPVSHIWYFKGIPSRMGLILDISPRYLEKVLYFASYIVLDAGSTTLEYKQILSEAEFRNAESEFGNNFRVGMGAEAIKELLQNIDLEKESAELKEELANSNGQKKARIVKRLEVVEAFRNSENKPEWMIMDAIPVIPPDIRPMVQLDGGRFATSDLNDLYRRIINRNNRLKKLLELGAPDIIVRNEKRMLQEAVDALIDNGRRGRAVTGPGNRALKSLSDMLKGKQGRFRQNLLGKRVDYSGRSVIVVGPELKIYQCGLPKEMAIELFKPFVMKELTARGLANNIKAAKKLVEKLDTVVWDVLEDVIKEHPVMLNRAPTLHRLGIQAFEPILVEGKAIKLHPLVCTAYNADFDGDQMAVHLPLSVEAQAECRFLLLSPNNLLKPSDGGPVAVPSQDMVLGIYYLTMDKFAEISEEEALAQGIAKEYLKDDENANLDDLNADGLAGVVKASDIVKVRVIKKTSIDKDTKKAEHFYKDIYGSVKAFMKPVFGSTNLAMLAYENGEITLHQKIKVKRTVTTADGEVVSGIIECTMGKLIFNEVVPQDLGFVDRSKKENALKLEIDFHVGKKQLKKILDKCINTHGATKTAEVLDDIKAMGYKYSTKGAITVSVSDMTVPAVKKDLLAEAQETVDKIANFYGRGYLTEEERYKSVVKIWTATDNRLTKALLDGLDKYNNIYMMADSGARGSDQQIKQLAGMRGLMADTSGRTIELPIKANFREGLDVLDYFISAHGARKGLSDTALRTADSGYLTRRLVDVSQDLIIREVDCQADSDEKPGMSVQAFMDGKKEIESLQERITGRYLADSIFDKNGVMLVKKNHMVTPKRADLIISKGVDNDGKPFTYYTLTVALTDSKKDAPVAKATVEILGSDGNVVAEVVTDGNGMATVEKLAYDEYSVNVVKAPKGASVVEKVTLSNSGSRKGARIRIRTVITCKSHIGICSKCYGANMATGQAVQVGEAVGIIAAQSIGEPGTQLTMRTFHTGGVAGDDITQGLPRVEELFEARKPKGLAILVEFGGEVEIRDTKKKREVVITNKETGESKAYLIPFGSRLKVEDGQILEAGDELTIGSVNPHQLLEIKGVRAVQDYIIKEVQGVYRTQGVEINDKHIEVIVRQMLKKIKVEDNGDTKYLPGTLVDALEFEDENNKMIAEGKKPAVGTQNILGITKASLATNSFLSAASFQETTKVLTEAAIKGKVDPLIGLKENVLIGKLIPAGTGMKRYRDVKLDTGEEDIVEEVEEEVVAIATEVAEPEADAINPEDDSTDEE
ncbi:MAG: DNA-directed RNA polymerase subunit beta' [Lachnospiraceae bacterium]|nr:DNA-directed RNA polymerase subunit beta' [Lachnospiraceae bacterium]